jgi:hypothetical protein
VRAKIAIGALALLAFGALGVFTWVKLSSPATGQSSALQTVFVSTGAGGVAIVLLVVFGILVRRTAEDAERDDPDARRRRLAQDLTTAGETPEIGAALRLLDQRDLESVAALIRLLRVDERKVCDRVAAELTSIGEDAREPLEAALADEANARVHVEIRRVLWLLSDSSEHPVADVFA